MKKKREACPEHFDPMASLTRMFLRISLKTFVLRHLKNGKKEVEKNTATT